MKRIYRALILLTIKHLVCWTIATRSTGFSMHNSDEIIDRNPWEHHCMLYYVADNIVRYSEPYHLIHQIISFCLRWQNSTEMFNVKSNGYGPYLRKISFSDLQAMNTTATELLTQSDPMDLVERYQIFLDNRFHTDEFFLQCERPWFGPDCHYAFKEASNERSFESVVRTKFMKIEYPGGEYL